MLGEHSIINKQSLSIAAIVAIGNIFLTSVVSAGVFHLSLERTKADEPISKLEVVSRIKKSKYKGRILSVKKQRTYKYPDCYHVKMLQADGEYLLIKVACRK